MHDDIFGAIPTLLLGPQAQYLLVPDIRCGCTVQNDFKLALRHNVLLLRHLKVPAPLPEREIGLQTLEWERDSKFLRGTREIMLGDSLYLENLQEFVQDESRIVI